MDVVVVTIGAAVVMVVGLFGVIFPLVPGLLLMWGVALAYGFIVGWTSLGVGVMIVLSILVVVSFVLSLVVPQRAAAAGGASGWSQAAGLVGAVIGFFVIPVFGAIVGALAGLLIVEYVRNEDWNAAWTATMATAKGFGISMLIDLAIGLVMLAAWSAWAATVVF